MRAHTRDRSGAIFTGAAAAALVTTAALGHVTLDSPNGGEEMEVGTSYQVTWHVHIEHDTQNWDLHYSTEGPSGPWIDLAIDLPAGS